MDWISFEYGYWYFETSGNGKCKVTGNIMSMLSNDPANYNSVSTNGLRNLFNSENFAMAEGSRIMFPATEATYQSYSNMFAESHASNITVYMPNSVIEENNFGYGIVPVTLNGLNLNDNMSNDIISSVVASTETYGPVTYHRAIKANWNTVCLPFEVKSTEYNKFYTIASLENGVITLKAEDELAQGVPALLYTTMKDELIIDGDGTLVSSPANTTDDNRLVGTFAGTTVPGSDASKYYFGLSANTGKYVKVSSDVALKPFRAYIECEKASGNAAGLRHRIEGEDLNETAIAEVVETLNDSEAQYFDMNGRKMNGLQKGLNIIKINGITKKVIIK